MPPSSDDLDTFDTFTHLQAIGVEFEGAWMERPPGAKRDPSLSFDRPVRNKAAHVGEIDSDPIYKEDRLRDYFANHYPDWVNDSCGMHFHVSFPTMAQYNAIASDEFFQFFCEELEHWAETRHEGFNRLLRRVRGENRYCGKNYGGKRQFKNGRSERYAHINYGAYNIHGTYECRVLPMFQHNSKAFNAVMFAAGIFDQYLVDRLGDDPAEAELEPIEYELSL